MTAYSLGIGLFLQKFKIIQKNQQTKKLTHPTRNTHKVRKQSKCQLKSVKRQIINKICYENPGDFKS